MAKVTSGSFNTSGYTGDYGKRYLTFSWSIKSQDIATNKTVINWSLKGAGGQSGYYYMAGNFKVVINGETVYSSSSRIQLYSGTTVASGTATIYHNNDGTKKFSASAQAGIYAVAVNCTGSGSWDLTDIPRYATSTQSLNSRTETSIKMNWSSDSTIDYLWYSTNDGTNWTGVDVTDGTSGTYTISGLKANTTYNVKTRVRRKDSQLTTDSSRLQVTTYDYPYCTSTPNFTIGNELTLTLYNPLSRLVDVSFIGANGQTLSTDQTALTTLKGYNNSGFKTKLYASIPNATSGKYQISVTYNGVTKTRNNGNTYTINTNECIPVFTTFTYKDINTAVTGVTGNDQVLVKGKSSLQVTIPSANKMTTKNSATAKNYGISIDNLSKTVDYSTNDIVTTVGTVTTSGSKRLNVRAYDSRNLSVVAYKDITVYDYAKPVINASALRLNNFEAQTTLKVNGTYTRLTIDGADKNSITSVQYRYREVNGAWSNWATLTTTLSAGKFTCNDAILSLDNTKAFEFEIKATDKLDSNSEGATLDIGQAIFFISTNKEACYINGEEVVTNKTVSKALNTMAWYRVAKLSYKGSFLVDIHTDYSHTNNLSAMLSVEIAYKSARITLLGGVNNSTVISGARVVLDNNEYYLEIYYNVTDLNNVYVSVFNQFNLVTMLDFEPTTSTASELCKQRLQYGLSLIADGLDANTVTKTGFYYGNDMTNTPSKWGYLLVISHNYYFTYTIQYFIQQGSGASRVYKREQNNGTWSAWEQSDVVRLMGQLADGTNLNDLYGTTGINVYNTWGHTYSGYPTSAYGYGTLLSIANTNSSSNFWRNAQMYIPDKVTDPLYYRTGQSTWRKGVSNYTFQCGYVSMTPTANTPSSVKVTFPTAFKSAPRVIVMPTTSAPGNIVLGASATSVDQNGFTLYLTRTTAVATGINWYAYLG